LTAWVAVVAIVFAVAWALASPVALLLARPLPAEQRELLTWFGVFGAPTASHLLAQLARGALLALALAPFRRTILLRPRPSVPLFGVVFGLVAVGSVEPLPGSIEGWFYTQTSASAHLATLAAAAVHGLLVAWAIPLTLRVAGAAPRAKATATGVGPLGRAQEVTRGRLLRFTVLHVATYLAAGLVFFALQDYTAAFASDPQFRHFRPLDDPWVAAAIPGQVLRGPLLALCLAPFVPIALRRPRGGLALFALLFVATAAATGHLLPGLFGATPEPLTLASLATGLPEVATQMAVFVLLLLLWERRAANT
jgi:hypothetical protein